MEKVQVKTTLDQLPVAEIFLSIQGEGYYTGVPSWFIRLAGCDVGCHWCDSKSTWDEDGHVRLTIKEIYSQDILQSPVEHVIITGGEPLMHDLTELTSGIRDCNKKTMLETSGTYALTGTWDWITCSPKKFKKPLESVLAKADELKVVIFHPSDFMWAESFLPYISKDCRLSFQPEWSKREEVTPLILDYILKNPQWSISLQIHKYLNVI